MEAYCAIILRTINFSHDSSLQILPHDCNCTSGFDHIFLIFLVTLHCLLYFLLVFFKTEAIDTVAFHIIAWGNFFITSTKNNTKIK